MVLQLELLKPQVEITIIAKFSQSIGKMGGIIWTFNLPAGLPINGGSCPYATITCLMYCYGLKGRFHFPNVIQRLNDNLYAVKYSTYWISDFSKRIVKAMRYFRIHSVGDFFSQKYFEGWLVMVNNNPYTLFLAYTRNYRLKIKNLPNNLILRYTSGPGTIEVHPNLKSKAVVIPHEKGMYHLKPHKGGFICYADFVKDKDGNKTIDCSDCVECWINKSPVYFPQKYKKYNNFIDLEII